MSKIKFKNPETQRIHETLKKVDMPGAKDFLILQHATALLYPQWKRATLDRFTFIKRFVKKRSDYPAPCYMCNWLVPKGAHLVRLKNGTYRTLCRKDYERLMKLEEDYNRVAGVYQNIKTNNW